MVEGMSVAVNMQLVKLCTLGVFTLRLSLFKKNCDVIFMRVVNK